MDDLEALIGWFEAHAAGLVLYARQWLDRAAAEDAVQEAFVRLTLQPRPPDNVKAWLYRTVRNEAIAQWRSHRRRGRREQAIAARETFFGPSSDDALDAKAAAAALHRLPDAQREIVVLRIWGQLTLAEISRLTATPVSTVFHQYQRGLNALREMMGTPCTNQND